jgi:hypothetical protein
MPRVRAELIEQGERISRTRIANLMRAAHLRGVRRRRGFVVTTQRDQRQRPAADLGNRHFAADAPNMLWVADSTYVPTWAGFIYLAVVLDVWSRRVVGWSIGETLETPLILGALNMALQQRKPVVVGVIHHSDQGSQYTSVAFGQRCRAMGVRASMGSVGDAYDNWTYPGLASPLCPAANLGWIGLPNVMRRQRAATAVQGEGPPERQSREGNREAQLVGVHVLWWRKLPLTMPLIFAASAYTIAVAATGCDQRRVWRRPVTQAERLCFLADAE